MAPLHVKAVVLGGGIGGLTAALSLLAVGVEVQVFEQAPSFSEIGAGIQASPNSARVLVHLGLAGSFDAVGVRPDRLESRHWEDGRLLGTHEVNGDPPPYGAPHYLMYRADLLRTLVDALPEGVISLGRRAVSLEHDGDAAKVAFADGGEASADVVIAADGIHSVVRSLLFGPDLPSFSGTVAYRGLVPAHKVANLGIPNTSTKWWGPTPEHHLVHYHIAGGRLVNVVGVVPEEWETESWTTKGDVSDFTRAFAEFHSPVPELVGAVEEVYKFAIHDRPPLRSWTVGRVSLLGDAAHPMVPFMAQGAAMAIEDAAILARCLHGAGSAEVTGALIRYDRTRRERTDRMQLGSRVDTSDTWNARDWVYGYDAYTAPLLD